MSGVPAEDVPVAVSAPDRCDVADALAVEVSADATVFVVSDVHLPPRQTHHSGRVCAEIANSLSALHAPVVVVLDGDILELLGNPDASAQEILDEHPGLLAALAGVREQGGRVVYVVGNHDVRLAWDQQAARAVRDTLGAELALQVDLVLATGQDPLRVRIEHGHGHDPFNCVTDPRDPLDTPLGHHVVTDVLPRLPFLGAGRGILPSDREVDATARPDAERWLSGTRELVDPLDFPAFVGSRLVYRRLTVHLGWVLAVVVGLALAARLSLLYGLLQRLPEDVTTTALHAAYFLAAAAVDAAVLLAVLGIVARRVFRAVSSLDLGPRGPATNDPGRAHARSLAAAGYAAFVCGHTHRAELTAITDHTSAHGGLFANTGCGTAAVVAVGARFGLPPVYLRTLQLSWLELDNAATGWAARLRTSRLPLPGATRLERLVIADRRYLTSGVTEDAVPLAIRADDSRSPR